LVAQRDAIKTQKYLKREFLINSFAFMKKIDVKDLESKTQQRGKIELYFSAIGSFDLSPSKRKSDWLNVKKIISNIKFLHLSKISLCEDFNQESGKFSYKIQLYHLLAHFVSQTYLYHVVTYCSELHIPCSNVRHELKYPKIVLAIFEIWPLFRDPKMVDITLVVGYSTELNSGMTVIMLATASI